MRKILLGLVATAAIATPLIGGAANAATLDSTTGAGFVGKGEVQSAFGWNNKGMQDATLTGFSFASSQAAAKTVTQTVSQAISQDVSQSVGQDLSCTIEGKNKTFHRDGTREGVREGTRTGSQTGTQIGSLNGTLSADVAYDNKGKTGQWTGFYLRNFKTGPDFVAGSAPVVFGAPTFTSVSLGEAVLGDVVFGDWDAAPGENPADCDRTDTPEGVPAVSNRVSVITAGDVVNVGALDESAPVVVTGSSTSAAYATGAITLSVTYNGTTKPLNVIAPFV